jgi:hypothetical protein
LSLWICIGCCREWYLSDRTQCGHGSCQCGNCHTGHNIVLPSVSVVPIRQDTMQSWLVSGWCLSDRTQCSHG